MKKNSKKNYRFSLADRTSSERDYLAKLPELFESSPFSVTERLMNFPLYMPRQNVANFLIRYEIFQRVLGIHGSIVECGVSFGAGLMNWAHFSSILEPTNYTRKIIGFDTFSGFTKIAKQDAVSTHENAAVGGLALDSYQHLQDAIGLYDMNRFIGHIGKVELVKGDATKTIPKYVQENPHLVVSLLYLDFDLYEPTIVALKQLVPRMPKGAIIGFDELNMKHWPGETVAVMESLKLNTLRLERFPFGSTISFAEIA